MRILFPMTLNLLTAGHIKCLKKLCSQGDVFIGLLTSEALRGYKKEFMSYKDREYILRTLNLPIKIVSQDSLNPSFNIQKYKIDALASGDGWEKLELDAIKKFNLKKIIIKLNKEKSKFYSSSKIINAIIRT